MGAGASALDKQLTLDECKTMAGDQWEDHLTSFWPEGSETISMETLLGIVKSIPAFAKRSSEAEKLNWDEVPAAVSAPVDFATATDPSGVSAATEGGEPAVAKEKVVVATREKLDMEKRRIEKLAEANGMTVEEVQALQAKRAAAEPLPPGATPAAPGAPALPPRAPGSKKPPSKGAQQSAELRKMLAEKRKQCAADGRPPSRGMQEMECMLMVKGDGPEDGGKQTYVVGVSDEPVVLGADGISTNEPAVQVMTL